MTEIANALGESGFYVWRDFLDPISLEEIRHDLERLQREGSFHQAGIGRTTELKTNLDVRKDQIFWLDCESPNAVQNQLWQRIDQLQQTLNQTLFLGLNEFEGHYAIYPEGGFYKRHRDSFQSNNDRMVSFILYLNRDWNIEHGGQLRIYQRDSHVDVEPRGGTLVLFMSRELDHEVLLNHRTRYSFAGWFKVRSLNSLL